MSSILSAYDRLCDTYVYNEWNKVRECMNDVNIFEN